MRTFVAIDLPDEWRLALGDVRHHFVSTDERWSRHRWVVPENLHVTLRFLGEIDPDSAHELISDISTACAGIEPFRLPLLRPVAAAGPRGRRKMLWSILGDPDSACASLAQRVSDVAVRFGVPPEPREYVPHITLARLKPPLPVPDELTEAAGERVLDSLGDSAPSMSVRQVTVYASTLSRTGASYTRLGTSMLDGR